MNHYFHIERHNGAAIVQIIKIVRDADGEILATHFPVVMEYETASRGATASARRALRKIEKVA
jgi:hypothetical protein